MKTQIIRLEPHDDLISARDKMTWGQTGRILLVWPERSKMMNRRLDLTLLQRHSTRMGAQLALVVQDEDVRYYAYQLGIPVYRNLRQAQNSHWRLPRRWRKPPRAILPSRHSPDSGWERANRLREASPRPQPRPLPLSLRLPIFSLGVLAVLTLAALLLPTAELHLPVETRSQSIRLTLLADPSAQDINLAGVVPARPQRVIVEGRRELPVSGRVLIPNTSAAGRVQFTNLTDEAVLVPAGTILLTQGIEQGLEMRFTTTAPVSLPAGPGRTAQANIQAVLPGSGGNVPAGSITAFEGPIGVRVSVTNPGSTGGGRDRYTQAPSPADRLALQADLLAALTATALEELKSQLGENDLLLTGSLARVDTLEESYAPAGDVPADYVSLQLRLEFEALVVSGEDVHQLADAVLNANLPAGFIPAADELSIDHRSKPNGGRGGGEWQLTAMRTLQAQLDARQVVDLILGRTPADASQRLSAALPLRAQPQIELFPAWWPRLPILPFRIEVQTAGAGVDPSGVEPEAYGSPGR